MRTRPLTAKELKEYKELKLTSLHWRNAVRCELRILEIHACYGLPIPLNRRQALSVYERARRDALTAFAKEAEELGFAYATQSARAQIKPKGAAK